MDRRSEICSSEMDVVVDLDDELPARRVRDLRLLDDMAVVGYMAN